MQRKHTVSSARSWVFASVALASVMLGWPEQASADRSVSMARGTAGSRLDSDATVSRMNDELGPTRVETGRKQMAEHAQVRAEPPRTLLTSDKRKARPRRGERVDVPELDANVGAQALALLLGSILVWPGLRPRRTRA